MAGPDIERRGRLQDAGERLGPWEPPHNIHLGDGVWTITDRQLVENSKLRRVAQLVQDVGRASLSELRVIDLACEGGIYGIELARLGAEVAAVEGREAHVGRARFAAAELGLENYRVEQGDVREVTRESHGEFDVVLCLGILYHLDSPDLFDFVYELGRLCRGFMVLDTQISLSDRVAREHRGHTYHGSLYPEHRPRSSRSERLQSLRASLDNPESLWLTRPSLFNLLGDAGFTSVLEAHVPRPAERHEDRVTLVAHKGTHRTVPGAASLDDPPKRWPERERLARDLGQTARGRIKRALRPLRP